MDLSHYDGEADRYDATRGGAVRARAMADAVAPMLSGTGWVVDVAGGTGTVAAELAVAGHDVVVVDGSAGMLRHAQRRVPGRLARADARALPFADASVSAVCTVWLLHLLDRADADRILAEAARVLAPGGRYVTTVDKDLAHRPDRRRDSDAADRVAAVGAGLGLRPVAGAVVHAETDWASTGRGWRVEAFERAAL